MSGPTPEIASPVAVVGTIAVLLAYLVAAWCVAAGIVGNVRKSTKLVKSAVYGLYGFAALVGLSAALIIYAFVTHDFSLKYVQHTSDTSMSVAYKITAFWGGLDGSLLFWVVVLALFSSIAVAFNVKRHRDMIGYVVATIMAVQVFFLTLLVFNKNPFATFLTEAPTDGKGLNPLLQNYWMVIHPPSLYIGFVAATIPFAFGIGALASGRLDDLWLSSVRVWTLICFFFLTFGLILGGRWAYEELGWGGYWAWDPVENAGFLPWFTATAFLHSAIIQEQRGMLKGWNLFLVIVTFFLTIYGTFMTRAGVVESVHAFGEDNELALQFTIFMMVILVVPLGLLFYRAHKLRAANELESFASREFAFLMNNWILLGCAAFVLFATMFPTIREAFEGERSAVGPEFFNRWMIPLGLVLLVMAGAAPLFAWRRTTRERLFNQFLFPVAFMIVTIVALAIFVPTSGVRTAIFVKDVELWIGDFQVWPLPMALITWGVIAFVFASVGQEYWRGLSVRRKQTGSDPVSSLVGLVLTRRRKYGGYIVHCGIAVMFLGFTGKAFGTETDRTMERPAQRRVVAIGELPPAERAQYVQIQTSTEKRNGKVVPVETLVRTDDPAWFSHRGYRFLYEGLEETHDDNKTAVTAKVSIWRGTWRKTPRGTEWSHLEHLATGFPAKWTFHKGGEQTTEVSIHPRAIGETSYPLEDVYLTLLGTELDKGLSNFRIFINPLINFVWAGFMLLAIGVFICLIPQAVVDSLSPRPRTRLGRAADLAGILLIAGAVIGIPARAAYAGVPDEIDGKPIQVAQADQGGGGGGAGPAEHADPVRVRGGHDDGGGHGHLNKPTTPEEARVMKEILCQCGGCTRENLLVCKCAFAAEERLRVLQMMKDLRSQGIKDDQAAGKVIEAFVQEYGGEQVLTTPRNKLSWIVPSMAVLGGLGLLLAVGIRWVGRGRRKLATPGPVAHEDESYAERLDDELRDTD